MTRRSDKQQENAFYVPDGDAGEVWVLAPEDDDLWSLAIFDTEQTAKQYAEWIGKTYGEWGIPTPRKTKISTKMRRWD
jgi:hypothetical protein